MEFRQPFSDEEKIHNLHSEIHEDCYYLKWKWNENIDFVYIYKAKVNGNINKNDVLQQKPKIFTKREYIEFNGYKENIIETGRFIYFVFAASKEDNGIVLIQQDGNEIEVCTGKSNIYYEIKYKNKFFSKSKEVSITIKADGDMPRDVLCYVKKQGSLPVDKNDGIGYSFIKDFESGVNILPNLVINKDEYINVFFNDGKKYGKIYNLIPM